jgi:mRNA interferase YafQ
MSSTKKAKLPRRSDSTKEFKKDWVKLSHSGRYNMRALKDTMLLLIANDGPLPAEYLDHPLTAEWSDHRECHVGGDFLLIYRADADEVIFIRAGTHAELFR